MRGKGQNSSPIIKHLRSKVMKLRGWKKAIWFLLPYLLGLAIFTVGPLLASFIISFHSWDLFTEPKSVGLANYVKLLHDPLFWKSLWNTFYFAGLAVPGGIFLGLLMAVLLNRELPGMKFFRSLYFMPVFTPMIAVAMVWIWLYEPQYGLFNSFLDFLGIQGPDWLGDEKWAMISIVIMSVWKGFGYSMIIFLAALKDIPRSYYESAEIDGATSWQKFWRITFPLVSPITFFLVVMNLITSMQVFDQMYAMTKGGPNDATLSIVYYLYKNGFEFFRMGYASAIAWGLFIVILVLTLIQLKVQKKWVFYA